MARILSSCGQSPFPARAWLVLYALCMLQFFIAVDVTVVNAPTFGLLVVARLLQGAGEAIALPAAMAAIVLMFPEGPRRSRALSVWAAVASCGLVPGFVLSGIITAHLGWRWIFLVSVPFILVVLLAAVFLVEGDTHQAEDTLRWTCPARCC